MPNLLIHKQDATMSLKGRKVLIVDGDSDSRRLLEVLLSSYDMEIQAASCRAISF